MNQIDRYVLGQILGPFGFFALVFTGVIWLSQSLRIIDLVVNNGQSALVFLEFTALLLPTVMSVVLPLSAFAATLFAINRLYVESELVVIMGAGRSNTALARPVIIFGAGVMAAMLVVTLYLMPTAARELRERVADLRGDVANALIREGQFVHPADGLTVYVRDSSRSGEMRGIFIHDLRDRATPLTYAADRAALVRAGQTSRVVMFEGTVQRFDIAEGTLATLRFDTFVFDLSDLMADPSGRARAAQEYYFTDLVWPNDETLASPRYREGRFTAEAHEMLSGPLYGFILPLIALAFILFGGFRRRGFAVRIWLAVVVALCVRLLGVAAKAATTSLPAAWPLLYLAPLIALLAIVVVFWKQTGGPLRAPKQEATI